MGEGTSGLVHSSILEKIDGLFACNIGEYINLPQLVVVGNQSSGKSSVLAALTDLPFPRDSGLCTRFATQITFRRSHKAEISASIIPFKHSDDEHQKKMKEWERKLENWDAQVFGGLMQEAAAAMGVGQSTDSDSTTVMAFSRDVLVVEVSGPEQEHFSVIDVPGTFKRTTSGLTTKEDMALVDAMVHEYMSNPRSVMLAVVPCNVDIATQDIIEMAEDLDPAGDRTFGILTKPDLVDRGAEDAVVELIEGKRQKLKLGWHLLRNPGHSDQTCTLRARKEIEQSFFSSTAPWKTLSKDKIGIHSLRVRLQDILAGHLRREFPKVKAEMSTRLKRATKALNALGKKRQTEFEQREFLMELASDFQETVSLAINANYGRSSFFDSKPEQDEYVPFRLATVAVGRGEDFATVMNEVGHEINFDEEDEDNDDTGNEVNECENDVSGDDDDDGDEETMYKVRRYKAPDNIVDMLPDFDRLREPLSEDIIDWIESVYKKSRGFGIASFDPSLVSMMMKQQAGKWEAVALGYVSDIICLVHSFIMRLVKYIAAEHAAVGDQLLSLLLDKLRGKYETALQHATFLLKVELEGIPATYNSEFKAELNEWFSQPALEEATRWKIVHSDNYNHDLVRLEDIASLQIKNESSSIVMEIYDTLYAYYSISRKRFVDNIRMQVADHFLVIGPDNPLRLFSPKYVASLTVDQLEEIAGEDLSVKRRRAEIEKEIERMKKGRQILQ